MIDKEPFLNEIISKIEYCLNNQFYDDIETEIIELKDLSTGGDWTSLKETICAYLNTNGGYIICGIRERDKTYHLAGFDRNNEGKLIELQSKIFKSDMDVLVNLSDNISFIYTNILDKNVAIIIVKPLSEDLKFVSYNGKYFERVLTQDKLIAPTKLLRHKEYKAEIEYSKEISIVTGAKLDDLDVDKINQFIIKINTTGKKETVKKDILDAFDFLKRRYCINELGEITVLGLLLFGREPFLQLEYRSEIDCYFETGNDIGRDKKYFQNDILNLMDDAFAFVWGHIKVGRSHVGGGRSEPEFPEKLIREVINNAIAHRDYIVNKFITIKINPGSSIEIKNPGNFKQKMLIIETNEEHEIRRVIPGVPETKNPKLANVLKAFDKIESQGIGMATLVSVCLENLIDVPYYDLSIPESISLVIPSGKLLDDETKRWLDSFRAYINEKLEGKLTLQHELVLAYFLKSEKLNENRFYTILYSRSNNHSDVILDLKGAGLILELPHVRDEQTPIYVLEKELKVLDFRNQIEKEKNIKLTDFDDITSKILNIIYRYNKYNKQSVKPSVITPELYFQLYGKEIIPTSYESLGRKVRKICNELEKIGILTKGNDKAYNI